MENNKKSFILFNDMVGVIKELTDEQAGRVFKSVFLYVGGEETTELSQTEKVVFMMIKNSIDRSSKLWEEKKKRRSDAGKRGMESRWKGSITKDNNVINAITKDNNVIDVITEDNKPYQSITNITDSVSVSGSVSGSVISNTEEQPKKKGEKVVYSYKDGLAGLKEKVRARIDEMVGLEEGLDKADLANRIAVWMVNKQSEKSWFDMAGTVLKFADGAPTSRAPEKSQLPNLTNYVETNG